MQNLDWAGGRTDSASRTTYCFGDWRCGGRALLRALLHSTGSTPYSACSAVLRAGLDQKNPTASLVATTFSHLWLVGAHHYCLFNFSLGSADWQAQTVRGGTILVRAFGPCRQDFRLG